MKNLIAFVSVAGVAGLAAGQDVIASQDFDGGAINLISSTNSVNDDDWGPGDMFGLGSRSSLQGNGFGLPFAITDDSVTPANGNNLRTNDDEAVVGQMKTDTFFGVVDTINNANPSGEGTATWTFDTSGALSLDNIAIDFGAMGDFESFNDSYVFTVSDGTTTATAFDFFSDDSASFTYSAFDNGETFTVNDPLIEQISGQIIDKTDAATGEFQNRIAFDLSNFNTGTLTLTFVATTDGGSEAFAFDNIVIEGTIPTPGTMAVLGLGGLAAARRRRG